MRFLCFALIQLSRVHSALRQRGLLCDVGQVIELRLHLLRQALHLLRRVKLAALRRPARAHRRTDRKSVV